MIKRASATLPLNPAAKPLSLPEDKYCDNAVINRLAWYLPSECDGTFQRRVIRCQYTDSYISIPYALLLLRYLFDIMTNIKIDKDNKG